MSCKKMWFGTRERMRWIDAPLSGADSSPEAWGASGTLLNGYGYAFNSFGSHKVYGYEWRKSSAREAAQIMKSYADGTYGRGRLYFIEPTIYSTNVIPARWADPSTGLEDEGVSLVPGVEPTWVRTSGARVNDLPVRSAVYKLDAIQPGPPAFEDGLFVPIPEDHVLRVGAFYSATGLAGVFVAPVNEDGIVGTGVKLPPLANDSASVLNYSVPAGTAGALIYPGKTGNAAASLTWAATIARVVSQDDPVSSLDYGPWVGGQGHSGCEMVGKPSYVTYTGLNGGQVGYAATFKEVL